LGHFLLTELLMEKIQKSKEGRIVNLSSLAHTSAKNNKLNFNDLNWKDSYKDWDAYSASKLSNIYFTKELAKRYPEIKACSVHPGVVRTELGRYMFEGKPIK